ncbi:uncharacterized protein SAPINGB_P004686 [Magnusiomyces paraingens]|uniref:Major facilitator superfamily (MFS) profile domain-containing protein n=1 Tax=Magnusiomyces paraingens TaxID=2606893 RepID=A0A5E8BYF9_9ASCO|nr:uncharacterized protein SAPINGB_P004686 [Saprochaete ingens]VVT55669.1 unnamed protein product [Saprochaete ingens]
MVISPKIKPYIPHLRQIDEEQFVYQINSRIKNCSIISLNDSQKDSDAEKEVGEALVHAPEVEYELRDEANRKCWKLFNEYEYKRNAGENKTKWYHWFDQNDSPKEKKLLMKLDLLLCFFSFVMYWVKYLDQANINNAYVSGMKEDLRMKGNDLVNTQAVYTVGSVVFQLPMMYLIHRYPTNIILPVMDLGWGLFTLAIYQSHSLRDLQAYRFFVGVFEAAFYPTIHYLFGSWYKPSEYARRGGFYYFGQMLGLCTAGLIMSSCIKLDGINDIAGWRWMFIIDSIITIPIAVIGFFVLPGTPKYCYSLFLTDEEIYIARKRLRDANIAIEEEEPKFLSKNLWKNLLGTWKFYMFVFLSILVSNTSNASNGSFILWLKSLDRYSISKVNTLSSITPALGIIYIFLTTTLSDKTQSRWGAIIFSQFFNFLGNILLAIWNIPEGAKWFAFCIQYFGWAVSSVIYSWAADTMRHDPQQRAITIVSMNLIGQASSAVLSILVWKTSEAPRFKKGFSFVSAVSITIMIWATIMLPFYKKDERKHALENRIIVYNSKSDEVPRLVESSEKTVETLSKTS